MFSRQSKRLVARIVARWSRRTCGSISVRAVSLGLAGLVWMNSDFRGRRGKEEDPVGYQNGGEERPVGGDEAPDSNGGADGDNSNDVSGEERGGNEEDAGGDEATGDSQALVLAVA